MDALGLLLAVLLTSTLSGAMGMGGGMLLMALLAVTLPVPAALALHGILQLASNGFRALLLRRHARLDLVLPYALGSLAAVAVLGAYSVSVERDTMQGLLGAIAIFGATAGSLRAYASGLLGRLAVGSKPRAGMLGVVLTVCNLTAGVSGPLLDVAFIELRADRHAIVATKATLATLGHLLKVGYAMALWPTALSSAGVGTALCLLSLGAALIGTRAGAAVLTSLGERRFRSASRALLGAIGVFYLARAALFG